MEHLLTREIITSLLIIRSIVCPAWSWIAPYEIRLPGHDPSLLCAPASGDPGKRGPEDFSLEQCCEMQSISL